MIISEIVKKLLKTHTGLIAPIVFLGELAKINKDIFNQFKGLEKNIKDLLKV